MADDTFLIPTHDTRRERLRAARRRNRRIGTVVALVVVAGGSVGAYALTRTSSPAKAATTPEAVNRVLAGKTGNEPIKALQREAPPRLVSHDAPLKLWIGGDSIAGELGPALGHMAGATGVVHTQVDYRVSSGLASNDLRNWYERATAQMAQYDPEAVVFEIGTNDASIVNDQQNTDGTPSWEPVYRLEVARMMDTLRGDPGHRRTVLWVGAPTMELGWRDRGVQELNRVMREEADKRAPDVVYVDAYELFKSPDGGYSSSIRTLTGEVERVRISDGVHLSDAGSNYLGAVLFSLLDARWQLRKHADPFHPINWDESLGSSGNGGGSSSSNGSSQNGSRTHHYTQATPAPPPSLETTAPPNNSPGSSPGNTSNSSPSSQPSTPGSSTPKATVPSSTSPGHTSGSTAPPASTPPAS